MPNLELSTPQRQAPLGVISMFLLNLRKWVNVLIFGFLPFLRGKNQHLEMWMFWVFAAVVFLLIVLWSFLQWKHFKFFIAEEKFIIRKGVLRKQESIIPLERIQSVHLKRNLVHQLFGLAAVHLDTAGSGKKEAKIPALKWGFAQELKQKLILLKEDVAQEDPVEPEENTEQEIAPNRQKARPGKMLMKLSFLDLIKVGLTENHLQSALLISGLFFGYATQYSEFFGVEDEELFESVFRFIAVVLPLFVTAFILISVVVSLGKVLLRYFDLRLVLQENGMNIKAGLLKKEENFVPVNKIQFIKWESNPLRRLIGYKSLAIYQASSAEVNKKKTVRIPGCRSEQVAAIEAEFYPEKFVETAWDSIEPKPFWQWRLMIFFTLPILIVTAALLISGEFLFAAGAVFLAGFSVFLVKKYVDHFQLKFSSDLLVIKRGYIFPDEVLIKHFKVQNVSVKQSYFQKMRGLVSLQIYTASGSHTIPFISEAEGYQLANGLLYSVESCTNSWM